MVPRVQFQVGGCVLKSTLRSGYRLLRRARCGLRFWGPRLFVGKWETAPRASGAATRVYTAHNFDVCLRGCFYAGGLPVRGYFFWVWKGGRGVDGRVHVRVNVCRRAPSKPSEVAAVAASSFPAADERIERSQAPRFAVLFGWRSLFSVGFKSVGSFLRVNTAATRPGAGAQISSSSASTPAATAPHKSAAAQGFDPRPQHPHCRFSFGHGINIRPMPFSRSRNCPRGGDKQRLGLE